MSDSENHNVVGSDGIQPIYQPKELFRIWDIGVIYTGQQGTGKYIPKVNDWAVDTKTGSRWRVVSLDQTTLIADLQPFGDSISMALSAEDLLFAQAPGWPSEAYRIYLDSTVFPYRLDVDTFVTIRQVNAAYVKILYGALHGPHEVISKMYDANGNFVTENVPLSLTALEAGWTNYSWKCVDTCFTNRKFKDGDVLTVVVYSQDGHMLSFTNLAVVNSNFVRDLNAPRRVIKNIYAKSPFLSETDPQRLMIPLNWNKSSMNVEGVVQYNDGSEVTLPIDGRKFQLGGWQQILSSIPGQEFDLVLRYIMDANESAAPEVIAYNNGIPYPMRGEVVQANHSYTLKLYPIPVWNANTSAYILKWYMVNLDRQFVKDVTSYVRASANSQVFNGALFGVVQRIQVSLNIRDVVSTYKPFVHTQVAEITLYGTPNNYPTPWIVLSNLTDNVPYGANLKAKMETAKGLSVHNGVATYEEWLQRMYLNLFPISETPEDASAVVKPTHLILKYKDQEVTVSVEDWGETVVFMENLVPHETILITWVRETSSSYMYLAVSALMLQDAV